MLEILNLMVHQSLGNLREKKNLICSSVTSLSQCVNNNIPQLYLGNVTFNFRLFSACVTDQSKCNYIQCYSATAEKYREDLKYFCKQSRTCVSHRWTC